MKKLYGIILSIIMLTLIAVPAYAGSVSSSPNTAYTGYVDDNDNPYYLNDEEYVRELSEYANTVSQKISLNIAVIIRDDLQNKDYVDYADDAYDLKFGPNTDGILVLINNDTKVDYISTSGQGILIFDDRRIQEIHDVCQPYLRDGDFPGAVKSYISEIENYALQGIPKFNENYIISPSGEYVHETYNMPAHEKFFLVISKNPAIILLTVIVGGIGALVFVLVIKSSYKFKTPPSAAAYITNSNHNIWQQADIHLRTYTTRTKIQTESNNSNGGGSSTHTSSSGGTHGGGGSAR